MPAGERGDGGGGAGGRRGRRTTSRRGRRRPERVGTRSNSALSTAGADVHARPLPRLRLRAAVGELVGTGLAGGGVAAEAHTGRR